MAMYLSTSLSDLKFLAIKISTQQKSHCNLVFVMFIQSLTKNIIYSLLTIITKLATVKE